MSVLDRGRLAEPTSTVRHNEHPFGKPAGLSLSDPPRCAEPAAYLTPQAVTAGTQ